jgi:hypothetical protein
MEFWYQSQEILNLVVFLKKDAATYIEPTSKDYTSVDARGE